MNTPNLVIGLCGTYHIGSDRYAVVISEVISPKAVRVTDMLSEDYSKYIEHREDGNEYLPDERMINYCKVNEDHTKFISRGMIYTLRKNGYWIPEGNSMHSGGFVTFGEAEEYRDPSF